MRLIDCVRVHNTLSDASKKFKEIVDSLQAKADNRFTYTINGKTYPLGPKTRFLVFGNNAYQVRELGFDDVPLSTFKHEAELYAKHGRKALERYLTHGERPAKAPKSHKKRLDSQVHSAYDYLRQQGAL